jgi:hypothetical protein
MSLLRPLTVVCCSLVMLLVTRIRIIQNVRISNIYFENVADFIYFGMMVTTILNFTKKEL